MKARADLSTKAIRKALRDRAEDWFHRAFGPPLSTGVRQWRAKGSSGQTMHMHGHKRGLWTDHKTGVAGDLFDLVATHLCGLARAQEDFPRVKAEAARHCEMMLGAPIDLDALERRNAQRERDSAAQAAREVKRKSGTVAALKRASLSIEGGLALANLPALVVWGIDATGNVRGGQRIVLQGDGIRAPVKTPKPSFGQVRGCPARFPARTAGGPLCIAEGPETALSIWQATGYETWAVFGAGQFQTAPVPLDRKVILCPDQDAPDSPAARSFRKAVDLHLAAGAEIWIAEAPEGWGSKRDLNDTLRRAGDVAVRAAIEAARDARPAPFHPGHQGDRNAVPAAFRRDILAFFRSLTAVPAQKEVARRYAEIAEAELDLDPLEQRKRMSAIRRDVKRARKLGFLPASRPRVGKPSLRMMLTGAQGVGKTRAAIEGLTGSLGIVSLILVPGHAKAAELANDFAKVSGRNSPPLILLRGRGAPFDPEDPDQGSMCHIPAAAEALAERGLSPAQVLCPTCPCRDQCAYRRQEARLSHLATEPDGVVIVATAEYAFLPLPGGVEPEMVIFDEAPPNLGADRATISFEALGERLAYEPRGAGFNKARDAGQMADALEINLAKVQPLRIALRDAYEQAPETALAFLRAHGIAPELIREVLTTLSDFEDRAIEHTVVRVSDDFRWSGQAFDLDKQLVLEIERHHHKHLKAFRVILETVLVEMETGRDAPNAVLRCENVNAGTCAAGCTWTEPEIRFWRGSCSAPWSMFRTGLTATLT